MDVPTPQIHIGSGFRKGSSRYGASLNQTLTFSNFYESDGSLDPSLTALDRTQNYESHWHQFDRILRRT